MALTQVFFFVVLAFAVDALKWKNCGKRYEILLSSFVLCLIFECTKL